MAVDLLQAVGLTKYEAEAYYTLLHEGPLTGYEVGKRSNVPQPRAYDVMGRLAERGLALVQPGDPPRYRAVGIDEVIDSTRGRMENTLYQLTQLLSSLPPSAAEEQFWVLRGADAILDRCRTMIRHAHQHVVLLAPRLRSALNADLDEARMRGCQVMAPIRPHTLIPQELLLLVIDHREALLAAADADGALVSANRALVEVTSAYVHAPAFSSGEIISLVADDRRRPPDWLAWEDAKQRRLRRLTYGQDVA